jgi:hypothetical protein
MSKLADFYKKAESDSALKAELEAANKQWEGKGTPDKEAVFAEVIKIAAKHGATLVRADFDPQKGELDESDLSAVAGGAGGCVISNAGCSMFGEIDKNGGCILIGAYR